MTLVYFSFTFFVIFTFFISLYGYFKYRDALNTLTLSCGFFFIPNVLALPYMLIFESNVDFNIFAATYYISILHIFFFFIPFLFSSRTIKIIIRDIYKKLGFYANHLYRTDYYNLPLWVFLGLFFVSFVLLAQIGGGGLMWLTDPRDAYMDHRSGAGMFYAASTWFLALSAFYVLWYCKNLKTLFVTTILFMIIASTLGSKGLLLVIGIVGLSSYHYRFRSVSLLALICIGVLLVLLFTLTQILQGSARNFLHAFQYFIYFESTARLVDELYKNGASHTFGLILFEDVLNNVPRYFYPDKPIIYGKNRIQEILNPGQLEKGRALGVLLWLEYYVDFHIFGVAIFAIIKGIFAKAFYELFRSDTKNLFLYLCVMQFSTFTVINYSTIILFTSLLIGANFILRNFAKKARFG